MILPKAMPQANVMRGVEPEASWPCKAFRSLKNLPRSRFFLSQALWGFFEQLSAIPRPSKSEDKVLDWLRRVAEERGLEWQQDAVGNMVIRRPGSGGGEHAPTVVLQGHVDMVCEKNTETQHDFARDAIRLVRDGEWLKVTDWRSSEPPAHSACDVFGALPVGISGRVGSSGGF